MKKILVIRSARLKEVSFVINDLKDKYPISYISVLTQRGVIEKLKKNEKIDELIVHDKWKGKFNIFKMGIKEIKNIRDKRFDVAVVVHNNVDGRGYLHLDMLIYLTGAKEKIFYGLSGHSYRYTLSGVFFSGIRIVLELILLLSLPLLLSLFFFVNLLRKKNKKSSKEKVCMLLNNPAKYIFYDSRVIKEAKTLGNKGYEVVILVIDDGTKDLNRWNEFNVISVALYPHDLLSLCDLFLLREAIKQRADAYHSHDLNSLLAGYIASKINNARLIYDAHELWTGYGYCKQKLEAFKLKFLEKTLIKRVDRVLTVNDSIANELERKYNIKRPLILMNCASLNNCNNSRSIDLKRIGKGDKIILYIGVLGSGRGLEEVIESAKYIKEGSIVFMGYGELEEKLRRMAEELQLTSRIKLVKPVPSEKVVSVASTADVGIVPIKGISLSYYLCAPNKLFQCLLAGLPVVASNLPELRKIIKENDLGELFDPEDPKSIADAINNVLSKKERYDQIKENVKRIAKEKYNWERESLKLLRMYEELTRKN